MTYMGSLVQLARQFSTAAIRRNGYQQKGIPGSLPALHCFERKRTINMDEFPEYLVIDGGFSTEVATTHGHRIDGDPLWSARLLVTNPDCLKQVHLSFLEAGADVIETSTYQATIPGFVEHLNLSEKDAYNLVKKGVDIACEVRDEFWSANPELHEERCRPLVVGAVAPFAAQLGNASEYSGFYVDTVPIQDIKDWHRPKLQALIEGGVDMLALETIPAAAEGKALAELLQSDFPQAKALMAFSCKDGQRTCHGELFSEALSQLVDFPQLVAVGVNCSPPQYVSPLLESVPDHVKQRFHLVAYPNSGETWSNWKWNGKKDTVRLSTYVPDWIRLGAKWIGGCCRTTPDDITQIRAVMNTYK